MKKITTIFLILTFTCLLGNAQVFQVGHRQQTFIDVSRSNRNIPAEIYYPANVAGNNVIIANGQFPILVFGHGFVMTWSAYDVIWNSLVSNGYIVIFPTTESGFAPSHTTFAMDMAYLVGAMKMEGVNSSSPFFGSIAPESGVMGHSMGGGCAFLATQYDTSINVLASFAAAVTNPSSITIAHTIQIPALVFSAANDCVAPPLQHQIPMYDSLASSCKSFVSITGGSHCQFANYNINCYIGEGTCTPQPTITAVQQQTITNDLLLLWLNFYLKNDCVAGDQFQILMLNALGIAGNQNCSLMCLPNSVESKNDLLQIVVQPNVFSEQTIIRCSHSFIDATILIRNSFGQIVREIKHLNGNEFEFSRNGLSDGIYFVSVNQKNNVFVPCKFLIVGQEK